LHPTTAFFRRWNAVFDFVIHMNVGPVAKQLNLIATAADRSVDVRQYRYDGIPVVRLILLGLL
jgi:hypothetical protein